MKNSTLKIGFQGWFLAKPYTGIHDHCVGLLRALAKEKNLQIVVPVPEKVRIKGVPSKCLKVLKPKWWIPNSGLQKWYWESVQVPAFFGNENPDWEHYPYPCPLPKYSPNNRSMTVHDTILWHDERYAGNNVKSYYHKLALRALVHADHIFTVSQSTHDELGIPAATVLPNAIPEMQKGLGKKPYGNALVYLGGYGIHKQVPALVEAFVYARKKHPELELLMIGKPHHVSKYYPEVPQTKGVKFLGSLSTKQVYEALKSSFAFVHFSDSEGFNIPLLQAMSAGTPAIVRDMEINREVSGGSAIFMDCSKKTVLSDKITQLKKEKKRKAVIAAQKQVAKKYSWEKSAKILLKDLKS
jgi:glycosyltransferase involved in cell wall biosynthesis